MTGAGAVRALMRACDWDATPLGPPDTWSASLSTIVRVMLTSRFAMWMAWGPELTFLCNDAYLPTVGVRKDWVIGSRTDRVWAEIWPDIGPRIEHVLATGEATWDEALQLYLERSGFTEESYHTFSYSPLADENGTTRGMLCVVAEVTERVFGERQLALLRDVGSRLSAASTRAEVTVGFEASLAAESRDLPFALIYLIDRNGRAVLCACHGIPAGGPAAPELFDPADPGAPWPVAQAAANPVLTELGDRNLEGLSLAHWQSAPEKALITKIVDAEGGAPVGYLVAGLNPHRRLDTDYRGFIDLLTAQISAAVARADEYERAREQAEALAEIDRAKTTFFSNVSHEFRTPLTLMLGPLEELQTAPETEISPDARRMAEVASRNGLRLLRLVNALLDFSRIEAGRTRAAFQPTDLSALTAELASAFRSAIERAGLSLEIDAPSLGQPVFVDREMWEKIVLNLLSNAFKFTLEGKLRVALAVADGGARLTVSDTGVGIPEAELPRLFERFHRVEGSRGRSFEGSGIGLALVQELVKLHGGTISVSSRLGEGTSFTVEIPLGSEHLPTDQVRGGASDRPWTGTAQAFVEEALRWLPDTDPADSLLPGDTPTPAAPGGAGGTVLVADDNADLRLYLARLLRERGYRVETAPDGEAALESARASPPDILLTDVMMPRLDGFGLLAALRADPALRDTPVIMLSARAGDEAKVEGLDAGADDYLTKPFSARELLARVSANLSLARLRREALDALAENEARLKARVEAEVAARADAEDALRQAQKMEAVGQLTGGIAHDFNNLLTIVLGNVDMAGRALASGDRDRAVRAMENARTGAERAAVLTHRLLAFSRRQPLHPEPTDVTELVAGMSDLLHQALGETVAVNIVTRPGLWLVEVDRNQLESALINLAVNARDAMPSGGRLTIEIANVHLDASGQGDEPHVRIAVTDTGEGMDEQILSRVFEPFFTTKAVGRGTGLGLSMVYGFVQQSGGQVEIASAPGEGTTVRLFLPRHAPGEPRHEDGARPLAAPGEGGDRTILVVEDDDNVRAYTIDLLTELGYRVFSAHDGEAALGVLMREDEIELLFTDVVMPGLSGAEVAERARALRPGLKVLFTSGYARDGALGEGRLDPEVDLIPKPFTHATLGAKLSDLFRS